MSAKDVALWLTLASMILTAGIWLGRLQQQVSDIRAEQEYLHGKIHVPDRKE